MPAPSRRLEQYQRAIEAGDITPDDVRAIEHTGASYRGPALPPLHPITVRREPTAAPLVFLAPGS